MKAKPTYAVRLALELEQSIIAEAKTPACTATVS